MSRYLAVGAAAGVIVAFAAGAGGLRHCDVAALGLCYGGWSEDVQKVCLLESERRREEHESKESTPVAGSEVRARFALASQGGTPT